MEQRNDSSLDTIMDEEIISEARVLYDKYRGKVHDHASSWIKDGNRFGDGCVVMVHKDSVQASYFRKQADPGEFQDDGTLVLLGPVLSFLEIIIVTTDEERRLVEHAKECHGMNRFCVFVFGTGANLAMNNLTIDPS